MQRRHDGSIGTLKNGSSSSSPLRSGPPIFGRPTESWTTTTTVALSPGSASPGATDTVIVPCSSPGVSRSISRFLSRSASSTSHESHFFSMARVPSSSVALAMNPLWISSPWKKTTTGFHPICVAKWIFWKVELSLSAASLPFPPCRLSVVKDHLRCPHILPAHKDLEVVDVGPFDRNPLAVPRDDEDVHLLPHGGRAVRRALDQGVRRAWRTPRLVGHFALSGAHSVQLVVDFLELLNLPAQRVHPRPSLVLLFLLPPLLLENDGSGLVDQLLLVLVVVEQVLDGLLCVVRVAAEALRLQLALLECKVQLADLHLQLLAVQLSLELRLRDGSFKFLVDALEILVPSVELLHVFAQHLGVVIHVPQLLVLVPDLVVELLDQLFAVLHRPVVRVTLVTGVSHQPHVLGNLPSQLLHVSVLPLDFTLLVLDGCLPVSNLAVLVVDHIFALPKLQVELRVDLLLRFDGVAECRAYVLELDFAAAPLCHFFLDLLVPLLLHDRPQATNLKTGFNELDGLHAVSILQAVENLLQHLFAVGVRVLQVPRLRRAEDCVVTRFPIKKVVCNLFFDGGHCCVCVCVQVATRVRREGGEGG
eukprot:Sspe_Gene.3986::Locus_1329_Transcript_1_1_Confidence_1.000_Length_3726::g.3986::m.3986